jgi:biopolymer transport protein ExbB/TolQ
METIDQIRVVLHLIADVLVWPVFAGLLASAAITLVMSGGCAREAWDRKQSRRAILSSGLTILSEAAQASGDKNLPLRLESVLQELERKAWRGVMRVRLLVRVGPALGLMGTLIPMAYALQGLSEGNLPDLAGNLVTAFAATVIGLAISVFAYLIAAAQEEWVRADLQLLGLHAESLLQSGGAEWPMKH